MNMLRNSTASLKDGLSALGDLTARSVFGAESSLAWSELAAGSVLAGRANELCGRSVVVATTHQLGAIAALVELDGLPAASFSTLPTCQWNTSPMSSSRQPWTQSSPIDQPRDSTFQALPG